MILLPPAFAVPTKKGADSFTVALLHANGADESITFTDETGKTWTGAGNAQIDTAQSVFGGAALLLDGTGDYIESADSLDWQLDGGADANEWTFDCRVRYNGDPGTGIQAFYAQVVDANNYQVFRLSNNTLQILVASGGAAIVNLSNAWNPAAATWYHVAIVKFGVTGYLMFVDGTQVGSTQTDTSTLPNFAAVMRVGVEGAANLVNGWLDEIRFSKGVARWTGNFTPPTSEY